MAKFRKNPVVIEAVQYTEMDAEGDPVFETDPTGWLSKSMELPEGSNGEVFWDEDGLKIRTLGGVHLAQPGDWIIQGVKGELYPCKPDIFTATYEAA